MKKNMIKSMKKSIMDLPTPSSISLLWNMGFLLGMTLMLQMVSGIVLSMMYFPQTETAFKTIIMIMRDCNMGWATRIMHMNGASLFFATMYIHIARGIYFSSPANKPKVWMTGISILLMSMATAFLGYVLPWGQMSFWGATVITGVITAIPMVGSDMVTWIWGGSSVAQPTLNRFFSLHFMIPMIISLTVVMHLIMLHEKGSSNTMSTVTNMDKVKFHPLFMKKDVLSMMVVMIVMTMIMSNNPHMLGDTENFIPANPMVAPVHIQPEWYFLFAYAILRTVPSKLGGVVCMIMSILILMVMMSKKSKSSKFSPFMKTKFWILTTTFLVLTWVGSMPVEAPFDKISATYSTLYFLTIMIMCFLNKALKA